MAIPQGFIQELLSRVDVVDVVGRYVTLKKAGANFSGLCPFHTEKSPSFTVSPSKQFFHCFGCGKNGNAIGFLMEHAGMGFVEAVQELANQCGLQVPQDDISPAERQRQAQQKQKAETLSDLLEKAGESYRKQLKAAPKAIEYLKKRGVSGEVSKRFGLAAASLLEAEVVTADGQVLVANACRNADLFWALKGGGAGFGVVTRVTLKTHDLPTFLGGTFGLVKANSDEAFRRLIAEFMRFYREKLFDPAWGEQVKFRRGNEMEIAMVFQEPMTALNPLMTIGAQVAETARVHQHLSRAAAMRLARALEAGHEPNAPQQAAAFGVRPIDVVSDEENFIRMYERYKDLSVART